jgi:hypothetical protein
LINALVSEARQLAPILSQTTPIANAKLGNGLRPRRVRS